MNQKFIQQVIASKGEEGRKWLDEIPHILNFCEEKWSLTVLPPFTLSYNYVTPAVRKDGTKVVLKIAIPGFDDYFSEKEALLHFAEQGCIQLFDFDDEKSILLLEYIEPGVLLSTLENDDDATHIIASVMTRLWVSKPIHFSFPTLEKWFLGFQRYHERFPNDSGPLPKKIVQIGEELYQHLLETSTETYLLHGDLHHDNVVSSVRDEFLAIDPQGVIGERAHETAAMLRNPQHVFKKATDPKALLERRINILSEALWLDKERIRQWGVAQNMLSAIWKTEDNASDWLHSIHIAELCNDIKV